MNKCIKCGSYAFNLYKEGIDQGGLCDVHYWQGRAHRAEALAQPEHDCTRSHPHEEMSKECELRTEIARLTNCLKRANSQTEHLEREWYLRGDEIERLKAQPEQEPVAWIEHEWSGTGLKHLHFDKREPSVRDEVMNPMWTPLYTTPYVATPRPQRTWVGLTEMQQNILVHRFRDDPVKLVIEIERELKEKNT